MSKSSIYEKLLNYTNHKYFATYILNFGSLQKGIESSDTMGKTSFMIRNIKNSNLT